jgi:hypothetical protein
MSAKKERNWLPLESNPEVMITYLNKFGLKDGIEFHDLLALDDWALEMVPRPVLGALMIYPIKPHTEEHNRYDSPEPTISILPLPDHPFTDHLPTNTFLSISPLPPFNKMHICTPILTPSPISTSTSTAPT